MSEQKLSEQKLSEQRSMPRGRTLLAGKIISNLGRSSIDCVIRRISDHGANISVESPLGIPRHFQLLIPGEDAAKPCKLVWQSDKELGVEFELPEVADQEPTLAPAEPERRGDPMLRGQMLALRSAIDEIQIGVVLLDADLRAQLINRAFRRMWKLPDAVADSKPAFAALMYHGRDTNAYQVMPSDLDAYIANRVALVSAGDTNALDLRRSNGEVVRMQCAVLPNGGRMLSYTDVTDIVHNAELLERLATIDSMTGLTNRRHFLTLASAEWNRSQHHQRPLSLLVIDIDHFKSVNDLYGHTASNDAVTSVAAACLQDKRDSDTVGRLGSEEFAILLPETDAMQAAIMAERIRQRVADHVLSAQGVALRLTISVGVASAVAGTSGVDTLLRAADQALCQAKADGRNRIVQWSPPATPGLAAE